MDLPEPIEEINRKLLENYGTEVLVGNQPRFRVVWSDDQYEKRKMWFTDEGFQLLHPEVRLVPKYKSYIQARFILERLVPVGPESDLVEKVSYEPAWNFSHPKTGEYVPPKFFVCEIIIESIMKAAGKANTHKKYKDPTVDPAYRKMEIDKVYNELFADETEVGDALQYGYGVTVPENKLLATEQLEKPEKSNG